MLTIKKGQVILIIILLVVTIVLFFELAARSIYPLKYEKTVVSYAGEYNLDPYLVYSMIKAESSFNPDAISYADAKGLMQLTDSTGAWIAKKLGIDDFSTSMLYDPEINIRFGCWYIKWLIQQYKGDVDLAVIAYNSGLGTVNGWIKEDKIMLEHSGNVSIPFKETEVYFKRVMSNWKMYSRIYKNRYEDK
jgi:soluble lytic murein transglycosylase